VARLEGKIAIVTGATRGLGEATARRFAEEGATVLVTGQNAERGNAVAEAIVAEGGRARFQALDVTDELAWQAAIDGVMAAHGCLDILVNNAGVTQAEPIEQVTLETWRRIMAVNAEGVFLGTKLAIPAMRGSGGGSIVNMSSILGMVGTMNLAAYTASKGAVRYFSKCVALECARDGSKIRVNTVHPAFIHTEMMEETAIRMHGDVAKGAEEFGKLHPVGHVGEPNDIANGVVYLASDEAKFVTGTELVIDGGYTAE
jgi:NAD(P)-dependent dehydrogenase (short-subunit alcohol dehydrogenase family)